MKAKGTKFAVICLVGALIAGSISSPVSAAKKVTIKGKKKVTMKVGVKKKFKANQKVKWSVKGKSVKIVKGKNAKTVTVQAKKKGTSTLIAKKSKKKATVKIQVKKKGKNTKTTTKTKKVVSANTTDMTQLTSENFYKVTKVSGKDITVVSSDNKEYTTTMRADIPVWRDNAILTDASAIQAGEYFKCTAYTYTEGNAKKTSYAALVIPESKYQSILRYRKEENKDYYTMNVATFYIILKDGMDAAAYRNGPAVVKRLYADEDTAVIVNGVKEYGGSDKLENGMRVLIQYGWEDVSSPGNMINVNSIIAY